MNILRNALLVASLLFFLNACGGGDSETKPERSVNSGAVAKIIPSTQTSDEIIDIVKGADNFMNLAPVNPGIRLARGYGGYHFGVDENNQTVIIAKTHEKGYAKNNTFICRQSSASCRKIVDNTGEQDAASVSAYVDGKIFLNSLDRTVDPAGGAYGSALNVYDIKTDIYTKRAFSHLGLNGETRSMVLGTDGYLYIGGINFKTSLHYPSSLRLNPNDFSDFSFYEDYWNVTHVDRARSIGSDDTHTYQVVGDNPYYLIALNRATGVATTLNESKNGIIRQLKDGVAFEYNDAADGLKRYAYLYQGVYYSTSSFDAQPPWYNPLTTPANHQGGYWAWLSYNQIGHSGIAKPLIGSESTYSAVLPDENGVGHASFTARSNEISTKYSFSPDVYAQSTKLITKIDNYLLISGNAYNGNSKYDLETGKSTYLGAHLISQGVLKGFTDYSTGTKKVFISGYPSGLTAIYDPFERFNTSNLNFDLSYMRTWKDINSESLTEGLGLHRPFESVQLDETVYTIGHWYRDGNDGVLAWYDTLTGETGGVHKGFFENYQTRSMTKIGGKLAIATQAVSNEESHRLPKPAISKIFIFDPKTRKIVKVYTPTIGLNTLDTGRIRTLDDRHIIGITNDMTANGSSNLATNTFLYIIDTYTDEIVMQKTIAYKNQMGIEHGGTAQTDAFDFKVYNGYIYTWLGDRDLVRIDKNGKIEKIGTMPYKGLLEFYNDEIFITGGTEVIRIKNTLGY